MSQIARHIEYLLLERDRVAVPGLGTLVCSSQPMHIDDDGMFVLPRRDVSMVMDDADDGILTKYVASQERCTLGESSEMIAHWVEERLVEVNEYGISDVGNIGQLYLENGAIVLIPCTAGLTQPKYFGLDNLEVSILPLLTMQIKESVKRVEVKEESKTTETEEALSKHIVIRLNRNFIQYAVSIAAAILLFVFISTPTTNSNGCNDASFRPAFFTEMPAKKPVASNVVQSVDKVEENIIEDVATSAAESTVVEKPVQKAEVSATEGFAVVVASSIKMVNAEAMVERLQQRGIEGAEVFVHHNMVRVAFLGYATREEAVRAAAKLRKQDKELEGAWVFEIK